jgi:UDP:flavonoid glycosyltransferase YjiC (YdhE family)
LYDGFEEGTLGSEVDDFLRAGSPPIVFAPGSANRQAASFFQESVRVCEQLGERGVFLTRFSEQAPRDLPSTVRTFGYVPLSRLLSRSRALVHHGGIGTTAQALAAGHPQLIAPLAYDQPDNARRAGQLGVARIIPRRRYAAGTAVPALKYLLSDAEVQVRCRAVAARFPDVHPLEAACDLIENLVK